MNVSSKSILAVKMLHAPILLDLMNAIVTVVTPVMEGPV